MSPLSIPEKDFAIERHHVWRYVPGYARGSISRKVSFKMSDGVTAAVVGQVALQQSNIYTKSH